MDTTEDQPNKARVMNKGGTAGGRPIPNNYPGNAAIPLSDVQSGAGTNGTTFADNDMVGLAGQPSLPKDVKKAAIQRRMAGSNEALTSNVANTGWNNST